MKRFLLIIMLVFFSSVVFADHLFNPDYYETPEDCKVAFINEYPCTVFVMIHTADGRNKITKNGFYLGITKQSKKTELHLEFGGYTIFVVPELDPVPRIYHITYYRANCRTTYGTYTKTHEVYLNPKNPTRYLTIPD